MKIETLRDVLEWTRQVHHYLSSCLTHCANENQETRAKLLLDYLADHERQLDRIIARIEKDADVKALNTWCYEYFEKNPVNTHKRCAKPFATMTPDEIMQEILSLHAHVIDVYRQLNDQFEAPSAIQIIEGLLQLEQHEAMHMQHASNRLQDI